MRKRASWTISPNDTWYRIFNKIKIICCLYSVLAYPYYIIVDVPEYYSKIFWLIIGVECVFIIEIMLGFFLQETNEQGIPQEQPLSMVIENYFKKRFILDVIILIPIGKIASELIDEKLRILWYIKCLRMKDLMFIFNPRLFQPIINWYIESMQSRYLKD